MTGPSWAQVEVGGSAGEPLATPTGGAFRFDGRGAGHGRGMSQWGAEGAAVRGIGYRKILATYYPGTRLVRPKANPPVRVLLTRIPTDALQVSPTPGLALTTGSRTTTLPRELDRATVRSWRVRPFGRSLVLEAFTKTWHVHARSTGPNAAFELRGGTPDGVRVVLSGEQREYRGALRVLPAAPGQLRVVDLVDVEDYLRSVVPNESMAGWAPAALQAQAVAARSWVRWRAAHASRAAVSDVCDTDACQMYPGHRTLDAEGHVAAVLDDPRTDRAVAATRGEELTYRGQPAFTEYCASDGGWTASGGQPYLPARRDPWDDVPTNPQHVWTYSVPADRIQRAYPTIGRPLGLAAQRRDGAGPWGGRVLTVRIVGEHGELVVPAPQFAARTGIPDSWWQLHPTRPLQTTRHPTVHRQAVQRQAVQRQARGRRYLTQRRAPAPASRHRG